MEIYQVLQVNVSHSQNAHCINGHDSDFHVPAHTLIGQLSLRKVRLSQRFAESLKGSAVICADCRVPNDRYVWNVQDLHPHAHLDSMDLRCLGHWCKHNTGRVEDVKDANDL